MKRFLIYTWPIVVYILLWLILIHLPVKRGYFELPDFLKLIPHPSILLFNLGGIYYLQTSPFGKTRNNALTIILICRLIIHSNFWFGSNINGLLHICIELLLLIFYSLRSFEKRERKADDIIKLIFFVLLFIETIETYGIGVVFSDLWSEYVGINGDNYFRYYFMEGVFILQVITLPLHITMLYKRKDAYLDSQEERLIEDLGKETN